MYSVKHIIIHLNEYDIMSAREPESCLQISAEWRMANGEWRMANDDYESSGE